MLLKWHGGNSFQKRTSDQRKPFKLMRVMTHMTYRLQTAENGARWSKARYINDKLLDRAPLRFAPRSTVLPAWLAPLAAKRSVASLPHNATGHTWSLLVTDGYKYIPGGIFSALAVSWSFRAAGHTWSQLVTTGHKMFLGHRWSHWSHSFLRVGHY